MEIHVSANRAILKSACKYSKLCIEARTAEEVIYLCYMQVYV
jgi:hypothetical protein